MGLRAGRGAGELSGVRGGGLGAQEQGLEDLVLGQAGVGLRVRGFSEISGSWAASRPRGEEEKVRGCLLHGDGPGALGAFGGCSVAGSQSGTPSRRQRTTWQLCHCPLYCWAGAGQAWSVTPSHPTG